MWNVYKNINIFARLVELVDTSDLKSDSFKEYRFNSDNEYFYNFKQKVMWYLISGQLMSFFSFLLILKFFQNYSDLIIFDKIIGWFLIDHILEEYELTSGKFFLINEDYRSLITNLIVISKNYLFLSQLLNPIAFMLLFFSVLIFFFNKNNKLKYVNLIILGVCICYCLIIDSGITKLIIIKLILVFNLFLYNYITLICLLNNLSLNKFKQNFIYLFFKSSLYIFCFILKVSLGIIFLLIFSYDVNNIFLDVNFKLLILYTSIYIV